ncbi:hypothetical protein MAR_023392 [Mya arenaria]|uniref:Uncharacterized protein n=1 Tax=Mya arenaria TaxID=6604 RepID=A0ABY7DR24_MYAAR|nr:hypothetical protein MAR_023392 [Mya arenaria]
MAALERHLDEARCVIKSLGFTTSSTQYGQMVQDSNKEKQVQFCQRLIQADIDLDNGIFTNESTVSLEQSKPNSYHRLGTINPVIPKAKHPAKVHVWGGISPRCASQMDIVSSRINDPKHMSNLAQDFMCDNGINWMDSLPSGN